MDPNPSDHLWMTDYYADIRRRWREQFANEEWTMERIMEKAFKEGENLDVMSRHYLFGREAPPDCQFFLDNICKVDQVDIPANYYLSAAFGAPKGFETPALCKYVICDGACPDMSMFDGNGPKAMDDVYLEHLRMAEANPMLVKARAVVRRDYEEAARQRASMMLAIYDEQIRDTGTFDTKAAWAQIKPQRPVWIQEISDDIENKYGFVIFKSTKFVSRSDTGYSQWLGAFDSTVGLEDGSLTGIYNACESVLDGQCLIRRWRLQWENELVDENDPASMRKNFETLLPSLQGKVSTNTFLVVTGDCVSYDLDTKTLRMTYNLNPNRLTKPYKKLNKLAPSEVLLKELEPLFVWAYDAQWTPPAPGMQCDEDGYQGRVKVDAGVLLSWFYYARAKTTYTMKELWRRAQDAPGQVWTAKASLVNRGLPVALV